MAILDNVQVLTLNELNQEIEAGFADFVTRCEEAFRNQVREITERTLDNKLKLVVLSGPTSSGKTTFSNHFVREITAAGRTMHLISLDDYYYEKPLDYDKQGRPDFESVNTLDLTLFTEHVNKLLAGEEVSLPTFSFKERRRIYLPERQLRIDDDDVLMVEGLHGLASEVIGNIDQSQVIKLFIRPFLRFYHSADMLLRGTDLRKLRRICRDVIHRQSSAIMTLDYWPMIDLHEKQVMDTYLEAADYFVNSALPYELCVIAPQAKKLLEQGIRAYQEGELKSPHSRIKNGGFADLKAAIHEAKRLVAICDLLPSMSNEYVPKDSILQEFL